MCGIAGVISKNYFKAPDLEKIKSLMFTRGPDKQDCFIFNENGISLNLYASRLKILDIEERSNQPFKFDEFIYTKIKFLRFSCMVFCGFCDYKFIDFFVQSVKSDIQYQIFIKIHKAIN